MFRLIAIATLAALTLSLPLTAQDSKDKNLDVRSPIGDLHVGKDADAQKAGLPLYPGARPQKKDDGDGDAVNLALATENVGMNLIVAKYETNDSAEKVLDFYRGKMKKYGKVLECRSAEDKSGFHSDSDDKKSGSPLKCEGDNSGPVRELKVGTEDNQRIVAIEDPKSGKATTFVVLYLRKHEKGDI